MNLTSYTFNAILRDPAEYISNPCRSELLSANTDINYV